MAVEQETGRVAGYYTMASASVPTTGLPAELTKKLPRYPSLPAVLIGRLAVDRRFQGRKLGAAMLADAVARIEVSAPATYTLLVDAKDEAAAAFYRHHGFSAIGGRPQTLYLPLATAVQLGRG